MKLYKSLIFIIIASASSLLFQGCTDDLSFDSGNTDDGAFNIVPENIEDYMIVPLTLDPGADFSTRADDDKYEDGTSIDHRMDFERAKECFAIFFNDDGIFMNVKPLGTYDGLGNGSKPTDNIGEFERYVLTYVHKDSVPSQVLVVINGGRIYDKLFEDSRIQNYLRALANQAKEEIKTPVALPSGINTQFFLDFVWKSEFSSDGVIGKNNYDHYTMTNSAYYAPEDVNGKEIEDPTLISSAQLNTYKLQTVRKLNPDKILTAMTADMKPENSAATIYLERMVAKFSPPTFSTQVIGSDRFFRPSQNALSMIIYGWDDKNNLISEQRNWRVHVLGWTINGREKGNYLFKHIKQAWGEDASGRINLNSEPLESWSRSEWNSPIRKRSFWSIDPHYDNNADFYPWQVRKALDKPNKSLTEKSAGQDADHTGNFDVSALRYFNFNYLSSYWAEQPLHISENTYNPVKYDINSTDEEVNMDQRANVIVGPHLLVGAEIYIEDNNAATYDENYIGQFVPVSLLSGNLYSDRLRRFYLTEKDLFKMFVTDFNKALESQENMTFTYYAWNPTLSNASNRNGKEFNVKPTGSCRLRYMKDGSRYYDQVITADLVDKIAEELGLSDNFTNKFSIEAQLLEGDGRRIPWIDGLVIRSETGQILPVFDDNNQQISQWDDNLRKSLINTWFGAFDHYANGYMYYWAAIPHYQPSGSDRTYFGAVRNHWYKFTVNALNSLGIPVDDVTQPIIPSRFNYQGMISCDIDIIDWHSMSTEINFQN